MKIAIIGAGWAGMAAAMAVVQAGQQANVFEAARTVGGRARTIVSKDALGAPLLLDNGQHILIGAYSERLRLMRLTTAACSGPTWRRRGMPCWASPAHAVGLGVNA